MDFNEYANSPVYRTANEASFFLSEHIFEFSDLKKMLLERKIFYNSKKLFSRMAFRSFS